MSDPKRIRDIPGFFLRQRSRVELIEFYDIESCFLSRLGVIPGGKPRQNTLMKAGQDPDNTGPENMPRLSAFLLCCIHIVSLGRHFMDPLGKPGGYIIQRTHHMDHTVGTPHGDSGIIQPPHGPTERKLLDIKSVTTLQRDCGNSVSDSRIHPRI